VHCNSSISWLAASLVHNDPRGTSPDISITPAPVTPAIPGHAPHSQAEDHTSHSDLQVRVFSQQRLSR
jgi:hypothetical protein